MKEEKKQEIRNKVMGLLNNYDFAADVDKLFASGCVKEELYEKDSYLLPKLISCALAKQLEFNFSPLSDKRNFKKEIENMYIML